MKVQTSWLSLLLFLPIYLYGQPEKHLPQAVAASSEPYFPKQFYTAFRPVFGFFLGIEKNKKTLPAFDIQQIPSYISKSAKPYLTPYTYCFLSKEGVWTDSVKSFTNRNKEYQKRRYFTLARLFREGRDEDALFKSVNALADLRFSADKEQQFELIELLAVYCRKNRMWKEAEAYYRDALAEQLLKPDFFDYGQIALNIAEMLIRQEEYSKAESFLAFAFTEYKNSNDAKGMALVHFKEAEIQSHDGKTSEAEKIILGKALPLFSRAEDQSGRMECFGMLGELYLSQQRYSEAKWFFLQQHTLALQLKNVNARFNSLLHLAKVKMAIKDYKLASADLSRAGNILLKSRSGEYQLKLEEAYFDLYTLTGNEKVKNTKQRLAKLKSDFLKAQEAEKKTASALLESIRSPKVLLAAVLSSNGEQAN